MLGMKSLRPVMIGNGPQIELIVIRIFLRRWGEEVYLKIVKLSLLRRGE